MLQCCVLLNGAQWYEQFLQPTGQLIILGFDLAQCSSLSAECLCLCIFDLRGAIYKYFSFTFSAPSLVGLALD